MSAPTVLINAISLTQQGGGRSYVRNLLRELDRDPRGFEFTVLAAAGALSPEEVGGLGLLEVDLPRPKNVLRTLLRVAYEEAVLPVRGARFDLVYCLADLAPAWGPARTVVALRNLNVYDRTYYDTPRTRLLFRLVRLGLAHATRVVCPSRAAAEEIGPLVGVAPERIRVIHHGIDASAFQEGVAAHESERPYLFLPANLERHKNIPLLFEGLARLPRTDVDLWIAGGQELDPAWAAYLRERVRDMGLQDRVRFLGPVPYQEILRYYRGAVALVFPSLLETFGHPLLEAMLSGTPVIAADLPSFQEIAGDAGLYFARRDPADLARAIEQVLSEPEATRRRVERGFARAREFTWERAVDALCGVFEESCRTS